MKTNSILNKIASILAFITGIMAVFAGGKVLLGILPDYYVIDWLPIYNFVIGLSSAFFASVIIWKKQPPCPPHRHRDLWSARFGNDHLANSLSRSCCSR